MPLQLGTTPIGVTIQVLDRDRNQGSCTFYFPNTLTIIDLIAATVQAEAAVALLSNGFIVGGSIAIPLVQSTAPATPPEESDCERKAVLTFNTSNPASIGKIEIPSVANTLVVDGTNVLGPGAALSGIVATLTGFNAQNGVGFDLVSLRSAVKRHRRSSKG